MSAVSVLLSEDHFCCSICLGMFNDPVTIPCGHNFCKPCITEHWENHVLCQCPNCNKVFDTIPELQVNICISEMIMSAQQKAREDICSVTNWKVIMSGLVCLICILLWMVLQVKTQHCVPLKEEYVEYVENKAQLWKTEADIQQMIQKRQLKIQEIKYSVELSKEGADREIADGVQVFTALKESVERSQVELINTVKEKQRKTEEQAEGFIKELQQEISELKKRSSEVEQLSRSEDHLHLLQSFTSLSAAPPTKDWTGVSVRLPSYEGTVIKAVTQLEDILSGQVDNLLVAELKRVQQYAVDVTFDPETAHPELILSDDEKQVNCSYANKNLPDNPERFDTCVNVLAKQSFSSGRFYYEVQVKGKTDWDLGVVRESIKRKGQIMLTPKNGYWTMWLRNGNEYKALADPDVWLNLMWHPQKVGVFVDYEEGLVSFYDADAAVLIYSFTGCSFTEKLYPYFSPGLIHGGKNFAPLIISPVNHTE